MITAIFCTWRVRLLPLLIVISLTGSIRAQDDALMPGSLVKSADHSAVYYVMPDGTLRHITDWATLLAWEFDPGKIQIVPLETLLEHPIGPPLTRWVTGKDGEAVYFLRRGQRYLVPDATTLMLTGGTRSAVYPIPDDMLNRFPLSADPLLIPDSYRPSQPTIMAATWHDGALWVIDAAGQISFWDGTQWQTVVHVENVSIRRIYFTASGVLMGVRADGIAVRLWPDFYVLEVTAADCFGVDPACTGENMTSAVEISGVAMWLGTRYSGLWHQDHNTHAWTQYTVFNSALGSNQVNDLALAPDGTLWIAAPSGLAQVQGDEFVETMTDVPASAIAIAADGAVYFAGLNAVGWQREGQPPQIFSAFEHPLLLDTFVDVVLDDMGGVWFIGQQRMLHFDGMWIAIDRFNGVQTPFDPLQTPDNYEVVIPDPLDDYAVYLQAWPRPTRDNGRGMHYLQYPSGDVYEIREQIARLERLGVRWVLVNYTSGEQLEQMAPLFADADITAIWRPFVRPYQSYAYWARDVRFLVALGLPPYIQVYNEPDLDAEWDGQPIDQALFLTHMTEGVQEVVQAGGYAGLQLLNPDWTRATLQYLKTNRLEETFDSLFFVPHMYGGNRPPEYDRELYSVIGSYQAHAAVFQDEIGFLPPFIAGEGGWRPGEAGDAAYPPISEDLHHDYHVAVFEWFRTGEMSNGVPLPDHLFAFCPWLLSDSNDPAAWYDSTSGNRTATIQTVEALIPFVRQFSWD